MLEAPSIAHSENYVKIICFLSSFCYSSIDGALKILIIHKDNFKRYKTITNLNNILSTIVGTEFKFKFYLPITPSCWGDKEAGSPPEPIEPEAMESLSLNPIGLLRPPLLATDPIPTNNYTDWRTFYYVMKKIRNYINILPPFGLLILESLLLIARWILGLKIGFARLLARYLESTPTTIALVPTTPKLHSIT